MMVINGVTNWKYDFLNGMIEFLYTHHIMNERLYLELKSDECNWGVPIESAEFENTNSWDCFDAIIEMFDELLADINMYNIHGKCE